MPAQPEFKSLTGGQDPALWSFTSEPDGVAQCVSGEDEWQTLNEDGSEGSCAVRLERTALLLAVLAVAGASSLDVLYARRQFKISARQLHLAETGKTKGVRALGDGFVGVADLIADIAFLIELASQRRLAILFCPRSAAY